MALELHILELDIWTSITANLSNTTKTSKHIMPKLLRLKLLLHKKVPAAKDEPLYALYFLRSLMKQKEKRKNSGFGKRSGQTHLWMSSKTFIIH
jgi:hypothetical protein